MATKTVKNTNFNYSVRVVIERVENGKSVLQYPIVEDGVKWETDRKGSPGKLTFKCFKDNNGNLSFQEGNTVYLQAKLGNNDWFQLFRGYIFTKKRNKDGWIEVTAYDALRYLKNKGTYVYTNKKASELIEMIGKDYFIPLGNIEDTSYVIGRSEDDQTMFDIIQNALDLTLMQTNKLYVLYCNEFGKLCLQNVENMKTPLLINNLTAEDFDYTSTIDENTYNEIELYYDNNETNKREYYNSIDEERTDDWGRLRYTESIQNPSNAQDRADKMLKLYAQKERKLQIKGAFGDVECRAGASVMVNLDLGDMIANTYMVIDKATHTFNKDEYRMDLTLIGNKEYY